MPAHLSRLVGFTARNACRRWWGVVCLALLATPAGAQKLGEVSTAFKLLGPNHKIVVEAYEDPAVQGVTCYVARSRTGGVRGGLGLAEDRAEASISCKATGPVQVRTPLPLQAEVFSERMSILFKRLRVVRLVDAERRTLVYLTYSDKLIDGSPQNSITAVPLPAGADLPLKK